MSLTPERVLAGYAHGIFPMSEGRDYPELFWVDPDRRGVLPLRSFHMSRSLRKRMLRSGWRASINADFQAVLSGCADRDETWINGTIWDIYTALHARGNAHSLEIYEGETLIGGTYGVALGGAWFGESMFSRRTDASKVALALCTDHLLRSGFTLFDTQFLTPHLASLGGIEISRSAYRRQLQAALTEGADFTALPCPSLYDVVQRSSHTS